MNEILEKIIEEFGYNEPIFTHELRKMLNLEYSPYVQMKREMVRSGSLVRISNGVYFVPEENSNTSHSVIGIDKMIRRKFLEEKEKVVGYRTGPYIVQRLGLSNQEGIPVITTNNSGIKKSEFEWYGEKVIVKKAKTKVNNRNVKLLQVLDLLDDFERLSDAPLEEAKKRIFDYIEEMNYSKAEVLLSLKYYRGSARKNAERIGLL